MQPILPSFWSHPKSNWEFIKAARENILNIIPNDTMSEPFVTPLKRRGKVIVHFASAPEITAQFLRDEVEDFPKSKSLLLSLKPAVGRGVFVTNGETWKSQHEKLIKVFSFRNVQNFSTRIESIAEKFIAERLDDLRQSKDITTIMQDLTFDVIAQIIFGDTTDPRLGKLREYFESYIDRAIRLRMSDFFTLQIPYFPNFRYFTERQLIKSQHKLYEELIAERVAQPSPEEHDFLEHLIEVYDYRTRPTAQKRLDIRDNLATFLIAGHETTAMTLAWALYAIGFFKDAQEKISAEATLHHNQRPLTESFIQETMRIYPPAPLLTRTANKAWQIENFNIRKGDSLVIPVITIHRHRDLWEQPDEFIPERFIGFTPAKYTYLPFGAGPRVCIGMSLAMMEAKIIFGALIKVLDIAPPEHTPDPYQILTLRSRNGIKLNAKPRASI